MAEGLWLTITPDQQDAISSWAVQAVQAMNDGFASDGWAGLINAGATVVQGLAEGITSGQSVFVEAAQGLLSTFSGLGESVLPAVGQAVMSLLGALNTLVPGIDLASAATAIFNAILDANPIILVISLLGMLGSALYGFAQTNTKVGETIRSIWDADTDRRVLRTKQAGRVWRSAPIFASIILDAPQKLAKRKRGSLAAQRTFLPAGRTGVDALRVILHQPLSTPVA